MAEQKKNFFDIPKVDFSGVRESVESMTDAEQDAILAEFEAGVSGEELRAFVARVEAHPSCLSSWDNSTMSFREYARRVKAGEYD